VALSWLPDQSITSVRGALQEVVPELSGCAVTLLPWIEQSNPLWQGGSARLDDQYVAKFAWSKPAAERVWHEAQVLGVLGSHRPALRTPRLVAASSEPALLVTEWVDGTPLTYEQVGAANTTWIEGMASELSRFLVALHQSAVLTEVGNAIEPLATPLPQATTEAIRQRLSPWLRGDQILRVRRWCDWTDDTLATPQGLVFVHGDFHGHNQVWDAEQHVLRAVLDFEESGVTDAAYDFRYLASQGPEVDLLVATAAAYAESSGVPIDLARVMAWNVRTVLGDALWRSEAGVALPDGGTPSEWVDDLHARLSSLGLPT
jgi:aminoglycoside phosphotransferase (APT) family kinase protein